LIVAGFNRRQCQSVPETTFAAAPVAGTAALPPPREIG